MNRQAAQGVAGSAGPDQTVASTMIVALSRLIENGDLIHIGVTTPLGYLAAALAKATHAPDARLFALNIAGYVSEAFPISVSLNEAMALQRGPAVRITDMYMHLERKEGCHFEPVIPVQIDRFGNANLSRIGTGELPAVRLPGVGGLDVLCLMQEAKIPYYTTRHDRRTFVEQVDFVTALGTRRNGRERGSFTSFDGGGPGSIITNLGVFDFGGEAGSMRLLSLHEGVNTDDVRDNTPFPVDGIDANDIPTTPGPTGGQQRLLDEVLDPLGMRTIDFLSADERRQRLRELLRAELDLVPLGQAP